MQQAARRLSLKVEAGAVGCIVLLDACFPYLSDKQLMDTLQVFSILLSRQFLSEAKHVCILIWGPNSGRDTVSSGASRIFGEIRVFRRPIEKTAYLENDKGLAVARL